MPSASTAPPAGSRPASSPTPGSSGTYGGRPSSCASSPCSSRARSSKPRRRPRRPSGRVERVDAPDVVARRLARYVRHDLLVVVAGGGHDRFVALAALVDRDVGDGEVAAREDVRDLDLEATLAR